MLGQFFIADHFSIFYRTLQFPQVFFNGFNFLVNEGNVCVVKKAKRIEGKTFLVWKLILFVD